MDQLLLVTLALLTFCFMENVDSSAYDKIVSHSRIRAKKEGPNVCALQQVEGTKKKYFSTCRNWYKGTICGKKALIIYECCPGYTKLDDMRGCPAVAPIDHVYGTLGLVKATQTQTFIDTSKIRQEMEGQGSLTIFAPSNDAWEEQGSVARSKLENKDELSNALRYHMLDHRMMTKDLKNGITVTSMYNDQAIYINHYSNGVVTVNCARIIHGNQVATNGVVHVIDRVISPVRSTIKDIVENDKDLSSFSNIAIVSGVLEKLDEPGQYTLFAPTNEAFEKLKDGFIEGIIENDPVIKALVKYHLLKGAQCAEAIMAGSVFETEEGSTIEIGCDGDSLTVNGIKMVLKKDIVASNGVIHLIDDVLIPDSAKEAKELMGPSQSVFNDLLSEMGLMSRLDSEYTILALPDTVFTDEVMSDEGLLRLSLENHMLKVKATLSEFYNGQLLETYFGRMLRVFIYRTAVCIENSCMTRGSKVGNNGALHLMKSLIKPVDKTIYELLTEDGRFKIFLELVETAGLENLLKQTGSYTIFAPNDDAFLELSKKDLSLLKQDLNALKTILLYHFSGGILINGGLEPKVISLLKSLQGSILQVKSTHGSVSVNTVEVPQSDMMATNGVVHVVKNLLYPSDVPVGDSELLLLLQKLIKYSEIKFVPGHSYAEIPLTFIIPQSTKVTRVIEGNPSITKVTRVIEREPTVSRVVVESEPSMTKVTRVVEGDPSIRKVTRVVEGDPSITKVTRVVEGDPSITKVTRVVEGDPSIRKVTRVVEGDPSIRKVTRVVEADPSITKVTRVVEGDPSITKVTRVVEADPSITKVTRVVEGDPSITKVTRVVEGDPSLTKVTRIIDRQPTITKVTRVIGGRDSNAERKIKETSEDTISTAKEPQIIEVPDFTKLSNIFGNPDRIDEESERITRIIQGGRGFSAARRAPAGVKRQARLVRRHQKPRE